MSIQSPYCQLTPGCSNFREGKLEGCASCNALARKEEKQKFKDSLKKKRALPKTVKAVAKRSVKREAQEDVYNQLVRVWKKDKFCEVENCGKPCEECHHKKGRDGRVLLEVKWWLPTCADHHRYITDNPSWAFEKGYSLKRLEKD